MFSLTHQGGLIQSGHFNSKVGSHVIVPHYKLVKLHLQPNSSHGLR